MHEDILRQSERSIKLLQALQKQVPSLRRLYELMDIHVSSVEHKELDYIVKRFTNPSAILTIGILTTCYIFQSSKRYEYDVVQIDTETHYKKISQKIYKLQIMSTLNDDDYVQAPIYNKLVFIDNIKTLSGIIGYRLNNKTMAIGVNPAKLDADYNVINIKNALDDFLFKKAQ